MAKIELNKIAHSYNPEASNPLFALKEMSLSWADGGRYALLGPSGCGKTTMLNIMSGLVTPSHGSVHFDQRDVTRVITEERNIAQVFQFPVIYGTMTVYENLAFPLKCRQFPEDQIDKKVKEVAEILNLHNYLKNRAKGLTADQKQLISLGRGLVREDVAAILMDEPLTVIDPDLKFRLRRKLKEINAKYKTTLIYVTHDQNEAMTFADNIIVMDQGEVVQMGSPKDLFERPQTTFVGYFIGSPAMNIYDCTASSAKQVIFGSNTISVQTNLDSTGSKNLKLGIRSEYITVEHSSGENIIEADVNEVEDFGNYKLITASQGPIKVKAKVKRELNISSEKIFLKFPAEHCCVYEDNKLI
jgi:glycerol transport system ATP-binding protein